MDSETSSPDYSSAEEDGDGGYPATPSSQCSRFSRASSFTKTDSYWTGCMILLFSWILFPVKFLLGIPLRFFRIFFSRDTTTPHSTRGSHHYQSSPLHSIKKMNARRDHIIQHTTDRRRGVIEVSARTSIYDPSFFSLLITLCIH